VKRFLPATLCVALLAAPAAAEPREAELARLGNEAAEKLRAYLRVDTSNPPGNEEAGCDLIAGWLKAEGIDAERFLAAPKRGSLVARLRGPAGVPATAPAGQRALMLLHHVDVVPAEAARWTHPPFGGQETAGGVIWGRGALDMKGFGIMQLVAFLELKRRGVKLKRDVVLAATADEEAGADTGVAWLLDHHPAAFAAGEVLNEGGMGLVTKSGLPLMGIQTAERGTFWVRVTAQGLTGHGSRERPDSAPRRLLRGLAKLEAAPRRLELGPESTAMLQAFATTEGPLAAFALRAAAQPWILPLLGPRLIAAEPALAPLLDNTVNPTVLVAGGGNTNVIPGEASAELDLRLLPGRTGAETLKWLAATLAVAGDPPLTLQVLHERASSRSEAKGALWDGLLAGIQAEYPGVPVMPILTPGGGTDSSFFRDRGVQALGCMPILATQPQIDAIHGDNEHVTRDQLARGTRALLRALEHAAGE